MRILRLNPNVQRSESQHRVRQAARAGHLRIIESAAPAANETGRLLQFHFHGAPTPAA